MGNDSKIMKEVKQLTELCEKYCKNANNTSCIYTMINDFKLNIADITDMTKIAEMFDSIGNSIQISPIANSLNAKRSGKLEKINLVEKICNDYKSGNGEPINIFLCKDNKIFITYNVESVELIKCDFFLFYPIERLIKKIVGLYTDAKIIENEIEKILGKFNVYSIIEKKENPPVFVQKNRTCYDYSSEEDDDETILDLIDTKKDPVPTKKDWSKNTIKTYENSLHLLERKCDIKSNDYEDHEKVIKKLYDMRNNNEISNAVIKKYVNAIQWYFHNNNIESFTEKQKKALFGYKTISDKIGNKYNSFLQKGDMTQTHAENNLDKQTIIESVEKSKVIASDLEYLVMKLYIELPRRLDTRNLIYIQNENGIKEFPGNNYYIQNISKCVFTEFKNKKSTKDEDKIFAISTVLKELLDNHIIKNNKKHGDYIFDTLCGDNHTKIVHFLQKTFLKYVGKKISVNIIRHSFASDSTVTDEEKYEDARKMSHSIGMHNLYKKRID